MNIPEQRQHWHIATGSTKHLDPLFILWTAPNIGMGTRATMDACAEWLTAHGTDGKTVWTCYTTEGMTAREWLALYNKNPCL